MKSIATHIKDFASFVISAGKYNLHEIKVSFSAPNPKNPSTETLTLEKEKSMEANFQWSSYSVLFTDSEMGWYVYKTELDPWGTKMSGTQEIIGSDSKWQLHRDEKVEITAQEIERAFPLLREPDLHPKTQVNYMNIHQSDKGHWYSSEEFKKYFDNDFYVMINKDKSLVNPFGKIVGKQGEK